jgi:serine protease AprX
MATITINGNSMDPVAQQPALADFGMESADSSKSGYILLQTKGPLTKEQKADLKNAQVKVLEYVPDSSYIAWYPPDDLTPVRKLPFVTWAGVYPKNVKIEPVLRQPDGPRVVNALTTRAAPPDILAHDPKNVEVVLHSNADADQARKELAKAAGLDPSAIRIDGHKARLTVSTGRLDQIADVDAVRHIEEYSGSKLYNNVALGLLHADVVQAPPVAFTGRGEVIAVCDTGLDTGDPNHIHPAFAGRVAKLYPLARATASDPHGHGTHVAGSVLGDALLPDGTPLRGAAPEATLVLQSVLNGNGGLSIPPRLGDLFRTPYENDQARVHSNSWGDRVGDGSYSQQSREVDDFVFTHRDCVICFAAGNDGADLSSTGRISPGSVGAPSTAKNCISVGASESRRPELDLTYHQLSAQKFPVNPIASDRVADNQQGIAAFSSRGPTRDHRFKPDLVGPGSTILSAKSSLIDPNSRWGESPDPDLFMFDAGTSMATPLVAGCAAVVRESFRIRRGVVPSAALVKAMLINGAAGLNGQYVPPELTPIPNENEGFGLVNLAASIAPAVGDNTILFQDEGVELDVGDQRQFAFAVPVGRIGLKVTLVWTDPAGEALQNDLDLIVSANREGTVSERHGNMPATSADFDRNNNVEQVVWDDLTPGDVTIIVRAFRIPVTPQSFALVARAL